MALTDEETARLEALEATMNKLLQIYQNLPTRRELTQLFKVDEAHLDSINTSITALTTRVANLEARLNES